MTRITTLEELENAALNRRAVVVPGTTYRKPVAAAWIISMQARCVLRLFQAGMFLYEKPKKTE